MGPKRRNARPVPYDPELLENWTLSRLREELKTLSVPFRTSDKRSVLVKKLRDARSGASDADRFPRATGARSHNSSVEIGGSVQNSLIEMVSSLADSVATLQEGYQRLEQRLVSPSPSLPNANSDSAHASVLTNNMSTRGHARGPMPTRHTPSAAAGSEHQLVGDTLNSLDSSSGTPWREFTLETAYRRLEDSSSQGENNAPSKRTRFGFSSETLPLVETISPSLRNQIISGRDVNLAALLIPYFTGQSDPNCHSVDKPDARLNRNLNLSEFILAFGVYKHVMCTAHPSRRVELDLYERDIVDMGVRYSTGFYEYHRQFSMKAAAQLRYNNIPIDWSVRDNTLFCNIFANIKPITCEHCDSSLHNSGFCPTVRDRKQNGGTSSKPYNKTGSLRNQGTFQIDSKGRPKFYHEGREICNNYNSANGCSLPSCFFLHACLSCKGSHSKSACPLDSAQPPAKKR